MGALPKKNDACVSLLLMSDDPKISHGLQEGLTNPAISCSSASVLDQDYLSSAAGQSDLLIFYVGQYDFQQSIMAFNAVRKQYDNLNAIFVDKVATPERAVMAMKAGATDYISHHGNIQEFVSIVEQSCMDNLLSFPNKSAISEDRNGRHQIQSLHGKIRELLKAAAHLATCSSLQEVCEGLLETLGEALGVTGGSLYLNDGDHLKRVHTLDPGHAPELLPLPLKAGTIFERVYSSGEPVLLTGEESIRGQKLSGWAGYEASNLLVYPMVQKNGDPIGIFSLHGKTDEDFTKEDRDLVLILASYSHETIRALYAQEKSAESLGSLSLTFENMSEGIILLNDQGVVVQFNQKLLEIMDLGEDQISVGRNIADIYDSFRERGDLADKMHGRCPWIELHEDYEYLHRCCTGTMINVVGNHISEGGFVLTFTDITEQKEWEVQLCLAKEKAEAASVSKTNFLANVSHELRTPLNAIIGFSEMMDKSVFGALNNDRYEEYVRHIHESGSHLLRLINNLLDLSKVEAGKFVLQEGDVHLSGLIENTISYFSAQAAEAEVGLSLEGGLEIGIIKADENALRQILLNLLSNAVKFTPKGGEVVVYVEMTEGGEVRVTVKDTGIGMEEKSIGVALQPFGQIENAFNRKYPGTGLGLPLVVSLTELHGGRFDIQSAVGDGTSCSVYIPAG